MQKTAFKVFLCSFSVSLLAMSVASRAFLCAKSETAPLNIGNKNISLFIKDITPRKYPSKKIDLNVLADPQPLVPVQQEESLSDDGIIVADELEYQDTLFAEDDSFKIDSGPESDEDQKIFLADVVYSQEQPLEKLTIDSEVVYAPETETIKNTAEQKLTLEPLSEKPLVYDGSSKESPSEVSNNADVPVTVKVATNSETQTDSPVPLLYEKKSASPVNVSVGEADNLNHIAMKIDNIPIESMTTSSEKASDKDNKPREWKQMRDNPWLVARSNGSPKNKFAHTGEDVSEEAIKQALDVHKPKDGVNVASETVKNLIIPLPDKLADNENLMPRLAYPEGSSDDKKERAMNALSLRLEKAKEQSLLTEIDDEPELSMIPEEDETAQDEEEVKPEKKEGLLSSLGSLLSGKSKDSKEKANKKSKAQARLNLKRAAEVNRNIPIMPREIRMAFQANKAEISGQTLRWVQAFATKAAQDDGTYLEVRIDGSRPTLLQQRRLNLLYNILTNKGVEYSKINVVYTTREPNSFILRMVNLDRNDEGFLEKMNKAGKNYLQW